MTRIERIKAVIKWLKDEKIVKNQAELGKLMDYDNPSSLSKILNGKTSIPLSFISRLSKIDPRINKVWLMDELETMLHDGVEAPKLPGAKHVCEEPENQYSKLTQMERLLKAKEDLIDSKNETIDSLKREIELLRMQLGLQNKQTKAG